MNIIKLKSIAAAALCAVGLSAFADEPEAVQLWAGGPYWATVNVGTSEVQGHPEYGALYKFSDDEAKNAAESLGAGWRLPTQEELQKLDGEISGYCTSNWDGDKKGRTFTGVGGYSSKSIFLPAAGYDRGNDREDARVKGRYWSSSEKDAENAWYLNIGEYGAGVSNYDRSGGLSVRAVRDTPLVTGPSVKVDKVESGEPWSKITVNYTLGETDSNTNYKVAFDITAGGKTASVTNDAAKLTDGAATKEIDTAALFGKQVTDTKAKVKVSLIAVKPKALGGVQLWENGPFWAECNVGATKPEGYGILTNFNDAAKAVTAAMGDGWRLPSDEELKKLDGEISGVCTKTWDSTKKGYTFTGETAGYTDKSIFLPAAGYYSSNGRKGAGDEGNYWSSTGQGAYVAGNLYFYNGDARVDNYDRSLGFSVRAVRDAK